MRQTSGALQKLFQALICDLSVNSNALNFNECAAHQQVRQVDLIHLAPSCPVLPQFDDQRADGEESISFMPGDELQKLASALLGFLGVVVTKRDFDCSTPDCRQVSQHWARWVKVRVSGEIHQHQSPIAQRIDPCEPRL